MRLLEKLKSIGTPKETMVAEETIDTGKYPKEVYEIHNEFEIAADLLLEEANNILGNTVVKEDKVQLLKDLGFTQTSEFQESSTKLRKISRSKEQIALVNYYKKKYPFNKFIVEDQVETICKKYNLVCGDVSLYRGFVPEKNLKEIANNKIVKEDKLKVEISICTYGRELGNTRYDNGELARRYSSIYRSDYIDVTLKICAPVKDMDISEMDLMNGYKLEKRHIPDPVVLQPVKGGYLVLTKWGDEANDPILANELDN